MKALQIFILALTISLTFTACKKEEVPQNTGGNTQTTNSCNPPIDSVFVLAQDFTSPDSLSPNAGYRVLFSNPNNQFSTWEATFLEEPVSGEYKLSDTLLNNTFAEIHLREQLAYWTSINNSDKLYVENNDSLLTLSFCDLTIQYSVGGDSLWGINKTLILHK